MIDFLNDCLQSCIQDLVSHSSLYLHHPERDFHRSRKLSFKQVIHSILCMGGQTLSKELLNQNLPASNSAFVQSRYKIKPEAFYSLFKEFTKTISPSSDFPILAVDGSDLHIPLIPEDSDSHFPSKTGGKSYNLLHLNALFDLETSLYTDVRIQKRRQFDECAALLEMMENSPF